MSGRSSGSAHRPWAGRAALTAVLTGVLLLPSCGGPEPEYLTYPGDDANWNDTGIAAAAVDRDGALVVSSTRAVFPSAGPHGPVRAPNLFHAPIGLVGGETQPFGLSVDGEHRVWVLLGRQRVPVRVNGEVTHPVAGALVDLARAGRTGASPPGALADTGRVVDAVSVRDDTSLLVATHPGHLPRNSDTLNVLVHRLAADGSADLVAGRPSGSTAPRHGLAVNLPTGTTVPATEIELDTVVALLPLAGDALLIVVRPPERVLGRRTADGRVEALGFLVLERGGIRRLPVEATYPDTDRPGLSASALSDGRAVVNVVTIGPDRQRRRVALLVDPATGGNLAVRSGDLVAADGTDLLVLTPRGGDPDDQENASAARLVRRPAPPRRTR